MNSADFQSTNAPGLIVIADQCDQIGCIVSNEYNLAKLWGKVLIVSKREARITKNLEMIDWVLVTRIQM